ncbi:hypothetical protein [Leuconostoc citreum]|uniref:hypothetical protein n=1 Tax=Leuconostoc citreum TaxID=33964 RepID=UPI001C1FC5ED|nr:hypothetical protein [Leuconostoc citreum]MBU7451612.1 hypothetical protein [Leuconostoc citreum]
MSISEFLKSYIDKNYILFKKIDNYEYTENSRRLFYSFKQDNPSKELPDGYIVDSYEKNESLYLVNLNTLVKVEISEKTDKIPIDII